MISIVIPVYNTEKYLDKCVGSIVNQTFENLEIILVDDGSSDNCPVMCDEWGKKDDRIKVIHKKNGGVSSARNAGLNIAKGDYIAFVDGDDWVDTNTYEVAFDMISSNYSDLVVFSLLNEYDTETDQYIDSYDVNVCNQSELFNLILDTDYVCGYACNKLFKKTLIDKLRFNEKLFCCEDIDFCTRYAMNCNKVAYTTAKFYHYRQRNDSMTGEYKYSVRKLSILDAYENIMPIYKEYDNEDYYKLERNYLKIALNIKGRMILSKVKNDAVAKRLDNIIREYYPIVMGNTKNSKKVKANIVLTKCFPGGLLKAKQFILKRKRGLDG